MKRKLTDVETNTNKQAKISTGYLSDSSLATKFENSLLLVCSLAETFRIFEVCFSTNINKKHNNTAILIYLTEQMLSKGTFDINELLKKLDNKIEVIHKSVVWDKNNFKMSEKKYTIPHKQLISIHQDLINACEYLNQNQPGLVQKYFKRQLDFYRGVTEYKIQNQETELQKSLTELLANCQLILCKSVAESAKIVEYYFQNCKDLDDLVENVSLALFVGRDITTHQGDERVFIPVLKPYITPLFLKLSVKFFEFKYNQSMSMQLVLSSGHSHSASSHSHEHNGEPPKSDSNTNGQTALILASPAANGSMTTSQYNMFNQGEIRVKKENEGKEERPYLGKSEIEKYVDKLRGNSVAIYACAKYAQAVIKLFSENYLPPDFKVNTTPGTFADSSIRWHSEKIAVKTENGAKQQKLPVVITDLKGHLYANILPPTKMYIYEEQDEQGGSIWVDKEVIDLETSERRLPCIHYKKLESILKEKVRGKQEALIGSIALFYMESKKAKGNKFEDTYELHLIPFRADENEVIFVDCESDKGKRVFNHLEDQYKFSDQQQGENLFKVNIAIVEHSVIKVNKLTFSAGNRF